MGIPFTENDWNNLAVALGGMEKGLTPPEMARAYTTLGDRGSYKNDTTIRRIEDSTGKTVYQAQLLKEQVLSEETAFIVSSMLQSAAATGTAHRQRTECSCQNRNRAAAAKPLNTQISMVQTTSGWLPIIRSIPLLLDGL